MKLLLSIFCFFCFSTVALSSQEILLAGSDTGLYRITSNGILSVLPNKSIKKIMAHPSGWFFLTDTGILFSTNLTEFSDRSEGIPKKILKIPEAGGKRFTAETTELKDLEVHPTNPTILVTATKDAVFLSRDTGITWQNIGISAVTTGIKAVAVCDLPDATGKLQLTVFMSHPIYGVSFKLPDAATPAWVDINKGLQKMPTITNWPDEVADISAINRNGTLEIYVSQSFMPKIYQLSWKDKQFSSIWSGKEDIDTIEGLAVTPQSIMYVSPSNVKEVSFISLSSTTTAPNTAQPQATIPPIGPSSPSLVALSSLDANIPKVPGILQSLWIPANKTAGRGAISLSELWLLFPEKRSSAYHEAALGKKGNYIPVHQVTTKAGLDAHLQTLEKNNLNMLVIDMKDDYGFLRYNSKDPVVLEKAKIGKGIDLEYFVAQAKQKGIYLVARIVVFKDRELSKYANGKYAVWDKLEKKPWQGYRFITEKVAASSGTEEKTEKVKKYYDEHWVDPFSEEVWQYNVAVSKELIARGFDEIQFDYIRFPTDGVNLSNTSYRWQDQGMDKESALMSFLSYARKEIKAPISIDIYGANGWYRTGARTGQDVELLARYVDAICPMFYPSHFEQGFLAQSPAALRPWRIYFFGSYRNLIIARNHVVIRPWTQAFYLNVSYDRAHYNVDYVRGQITGIYDSIDHGYTYWNNSGRYADIMPDTNSGTRETFFK